MNFVALQLIWYGFQNRKIEMWLYTRAESKNLFWEPDFNNKI